MEHNTNIWRDKKKNQVILKFILMKAENIFHGVDDLASSPVVYTTHANPVKNGQGAESNYSRLWIAKGCLIKFLLWNTATHWVAGTEEN